MTSARGRGGDTEQPVDTADKRQAGNTADKRQAIEAEQALLMQSLIEGCAPPAGFNNRRVRLCGNSLRNKRLRTINRLHPWLEQVLGDNLKHEFDCFLTEHPAIHPDGAGEDARQFIQFLQAKGKLPRPSLLDRLLAKLKLGC